MMNPIPENTNLNGCPKKPPTTTPPSTTAAASLLISESVENYARVSFIITPSPDLHDENYKGNPPISSIQLNIPLQDLTFKQNLPSIYLCSRDGILPGQSQITPNDRHSA
jgi:hypothetical protein